MADEYTPTMEKLRMVWIAHRWEHNGQLRFEGSDDEFDRALAAHDAEIRRDQAEKDAAIAGNAQTAGPESWASDARARLIRARILNPFTTPSPETEQETE